MDKNKLYKEIAIIVCVSLMVLFIHGIIWMYTSKKYIEDNEDLVKERLVGTVFVDDDNPKKCVVITSSNIANIDYVVKPKIKSAIGISGDMLVNDIDFKLEAYNGEETIQISGRMRLRYNSDDRRKWTCDKLAAENYKVIRVDTYVLKVIGR